MKISIKILLRYVLLVIVLLFFLIYFRLSWFYFLLLVLIIIMSLVFSRFFDYIKKTIFIQSKDISKEAHSFNDISKNGSKNTKAWQLASLIKSGYHEERIMKESRKHGISDLRMKLSFYSLRHPYFSIIVRVVIILLIVILVYVLVFRDFYHGSEALNVTQNFSDDTDYVPGYYVAAASNGSSNESRVCDIGRKFLNPGYLFTYLFYDDSGALIGKCTAYQGPGSSGGNKESCDSQELLRYSSSRRMDIMKYECIPLRLFPSD